MDQPQPTANLNQGQLHQVVAVLAHELRNPLSVFRTAVDLLPTDSEAHRRIQEILNRQVEHMTHLVDDLSDMSRSTNGKTRLEKKPVKLQPIIELALESLEPTFAARNQTIAITLPDKPLWINADPIRISQILINLLSNASKYSESEDEIQLVVKHVDSSVEIRVVDHGIGIEASELPKLFDFFSQSSHALDRAQGGMGIGWASSAGS